MINFVTFMHLLGFCCEHTGTISTNFKNNFDAQNAGNAISRLQISKRTSYWAYALRPQRYDRILWLDPALLQFI